MGESGGAEELVGGNAASEDDGLDIWMEFEGEVDFFEENINSGLLERGGDIDFLLI